ncbi:MAG TPA: AraC family transcriptional regulator [Candidatus Gemmiger excrementavium]|uniref:AraC family transcriptional regulator n=1 Tax=Candidatus Gemmiger excrementavium TaxID=2838608 RepID=A0A9D2JGJ3_9FIRM|nr:AraC family transcriptional regulator [Candidatus Gemmiger excrementavium]
MTENGFSNYSSFSKIFRKLYGVTPAEYRAQLRSAIRL